MKGLREEPAHSFSLEDLEERWGMNPDIFRAKQEVAIKSWPSMFKLFENINFNSLLSAERDTRCEGGFRYLTPGTPSYIFFEYFTNLNNLRALEEALLHLPDISPFAEQVSRLIREVPPCRNILLSFFKNADGEIQSSHNEKGESLVDDVEINEKNRRLIVTAPTFFSWGYKPNKTQNGISIARVPSRSQEVKPIEKTMLQHWSEQNKDGESSPGGIFLFDYSETPHLFKYFRNALKRLVYSQHKGIALPLAKELTHKQYDPLWKDFFVVETERLIGDEDQVELSAIRGFWESGNRKIIASLERLLPEKDIFFERRNRVLGLMVENISQRSNPKLTDTEKSIGSIENPNINIRMLCSELFPEASGEGFDVFFADIKEKQNRAIQLAHEISPVARTFFQEHPGVYPTCHPQILVNIISSLSLVVESLQELRESYVQHPDLFTLEKLSALSEMLFFLPNRFLSESGITPAEIEHIYRYVFGVSMASVSLFSDPETGVFMDSPTHISPEIKDGVINERANKGSIILSLYQLVSRRVKSKTKVKLTGKRALEVSDDQVSASEAHNASFLSAVLDLTPQDEVVVDKVLHSLSLLILQNQLSVFSFRDMAEGDSFKPLWRLWCERYEILLRNESSQTRLSFVSFWGGEAHIPVYLQKYITPEISSLSSESREKPEFIPPPIIEKDPQNPDGFIVSNIEEVVSAWRELNPEEPMILYVMVNGENVLIGEPRGDSPASLFQLGSKKKGLRGGVQCRYSPSADSSGTDFPFSDDLEVLHPFSVPEVVRLRGNQNPITQPLAFQINNLDVIKKECEASGVPLVLWIHINGDVLDPISYTDKSNTFTINDLPIGENYRVQFQFASEKNADYQLFPLSDGIEFPLPLTINPDLHADPEVDYMGNVIPGLRVRNLEEARKSTKNEELQLWIKVGKKVERVEVLPDGTFSINKKFRPRDIVSIITRFAPEANSSLALFPESEFRFQIPDTPPVPIEVRRDQFTKSLLDSQDPFGDELLFINVFDDRFVVTFPRNVFPALEYDREAPHDMISATNRGTPEMLACIYRLVQSRYEEGRAALQREKEQERIEALKSGEEHLFLFLEEEIDTHLHFNFENGFIVIKVSQKALDESGLPDTYKEIRITNDTHLEIVSPEILTEELRELLCQQAAQHSDIAGQIAEIDDFLEKRQKLSEIFPQLRASEGIWKKRVSEGRMAKTYGKQTKGLWEWYWRRDDELLQNEIRNLHVGLNASGIQTNLSIPAKGVGFTTFDFRIQLPPPYNVITAKVQPPRLQEITDENGERIKWEIGSMKIY